MPGHRRLRALLEVIEEQTRLLRGLAGRPAQDLLADPYGLAAAKYLFVVAIEAAIDASRHVATSAGLRGARDFADSFVVLGEAGHLEAELVERLRRMAGFRNLLVHGYAVVDDGRVVEILKTELGDLDQFRQQVAAVPFGDDSDDGRDAAVAHPGERPTA